MSIERPLAIDLFAGAGGLSEGFLEAGFDVQLSVDTDKWSVETQRANHASRGVEVLREDLSDSKAKQIVAERVRTYERPLSAIIGGPPCQGFSRSNMQTRHRGNPNNKLIFTFIEYVELLQPRCVVMENVAGLEIFENGKFVPEILDAFRSVGYHVDAAVLNAADYGVPQKRNRIFFIGNRLGVVNYFPPPEFPQEKWRTVRDAVNDLPPLENGAPGDARPYSVGRPGEYAALMRRQNATMATNNLVSKNSDLVLRRYKHIPQGGNWENIPLELMTNYEDRTRCHEWIYRRLALDEPSIVITNYRKSMLIHPTEDRGLSVREAARLQSFPDHFVFKGGILHQQQQVANAVPPLLAQAVARTVLERMLGSSTPLSKYFIAAPDQAPSRNGKPWEPSRKLVTYFRSALSRWAGKNLRQLPWRKTSDSFHKLVAEVLLQKTTAEQAVDPFREIIARWPTPEALAKADLRELRRIIAPLGMLRRAKRLKVTAQVLVDHYHGRVPAYRRDLGRLPGVGAYSAAAVACFAYRRRVPIVDTNVIRVLGRFFGLHSTDSRPRNDRKIWRTAAQLVPEGRPDFYNMALLDFAAAICKSSNPECPTCPLRARCVSFKQVGELPVTQATHESLGSHVRTSSPV